MKHKADDSETVEAGKGLSQSLVVTRKTAESRSPCEAALYHPAAQQQYKATLGFAVLDYVQLGAACAACSPA